jgi:hypothetical protein
MHPGGDTILGVHEHPHDRQLPFQRDWGIVENGTDFKREPPTVVLSVAPEHLGIWKPRHVFGATARATHFSFQPAQADHELVAIFVMREVIEGLNKGRKYLANKTTLRIKVSSA